MQHQVGSAARREGVTLANGWTLWYATAFDSSTGTLLHVSCGSRLLLDEPNNVRRSDVSLGATLSVLRLLVLASAVIPGLVGIFIETKGPTKRALRFVLLAIIVLGFLGTAILAQRESHAVDEKHRDVISRLDADNAALRAMNVKHDSSMAQVLQLLKQALVQQGMTPARADTATTPLVVQALEAGAAVDKIASLEFPGNRRAFTVLYFPKDVEGDIVDVKLRNLGFRVTHAKPQLPGLATNAIWYGSNVPLNEVKIVALTLKEAGLEIWSIRRLRDTRGDRGNLIEVGSLARPVRPTPYTTEAIQAAEELNE